MRRWRRLSRSFVAVELRDLIMANKDGAMPGIVLALQQVPEAQRAKMMELLRGGANMI
ncbi:hypothetical protein BGX38DRAFT_1168083 [Terfezia claveryi]|nr:hypothetical protein BGX38DRAFT_1168083 [Terfezia claveryi]